MRPGLSPPEGVRPSAEEVKAPAVGYPVRVRSVRGPGVPGEDEARAQMSIPPQAGVEDRQQQFESVVIRFAGDSGDGMQITGNQFTQTSALFGNDLATFPDFPAEIRAPAGTRPGVSGFQIRFASTDIHTPGDAPDVLVAMNP